MNEKRKSRLRVADACTAPVGDEKGKYSVDGGDLEELGLIGANWGWESNGMPLLVKAGNGLKKRDRRTQKNL